MVKILKQNKNYLNKNIVNAFDVLSVQGHYKLIGSNSIRNLIYTNDYDLNESLKNHSGNNIYENLYKHFLNIFEKCLSNDNYYILDFKCGKNNKQEALRWNLSDMKKGFKISQNNKYIFTDCLKMDATIKIDLCYIMDGIFIEITNNYFLHSINDRNDLENKKQNKNQTIITKLNEEIKELSQNDDYFKMLKRLFSLEMIEGRVDDELLNFLNSDYGRFYKTIASLELCLRMVEQEFKPVKMNLILNNLEQIKQFTSYITEFNIDNILNEINNIIQGKTFLQLGKLIIQCKNMLNNLIKTYAEEFLN